MRRTTVHSLAALLHLGAALSGCGDDGAETATSGGGDAATSSSTSTSSAASTSVSSTTATTTGGGGQGCGPVGAIEPSPACTACAEESCCEEEAACAAVPQCAELFGCIDACEGDTSCMQACPTPEGYVPELLELQICKFRSCLEPCAMDAPPCELTGFGPWGRDPQACDACIAESCCDEVQATATLDALLFNQCGVECLDAGCLRDCELAFPDVLPPQSAMIECIYGECAPCVHEPGCGPFAFGDDADCSSCAGESCCDVHEACDDIECLDFFTCRVNCQDEATCRLCLDLWPNEVAGRGTALLACGEVLCTDACGGGNCGLIPGLDSGECRGCVEESCCAPSGACGIDADCVALQICVGLCDEDADCEAACRDDLPAGAELLEPLETCKATSCDEACP